MPHPVPPPEPPAIVQTLPPEAFHPASTDVSAPSATHLGTTNLISSPLPKSVEPEPPPLGAAKSAELLGTPISVGYPVERIERTNPADESTAAKTGTSSQSIQPLRVSDVSNTNIVAKLKKISNPADESIAAGAVAPSQSIQPLRVSDVSNTNTVAKLKKIIASETSSGQTQLSSLTQSAQKTLPEKLSPHEVSPVVVSQQLPTPAPQVQGNNTELTDTSDSSNSQLAEFNFQAPAADETQPETLPVSKDEQQPVVQPGRTQPNGTPQPQSQEAEQSPPASTPSVRERIIELSSDRQVYDEQRQIVTAEGNVLLRFDGTVLDADRLQVNLENLIAVGEGNVALTRGEQVLRGERFTYNFIQDRGDIRNASGEIYVPTAGSDFSSTLPTDVSAGGVPQRPPSDRITANQPLQQVTTTGGVNITAGGRRLLQQGGTVNRLRFQAEQIDFYPEGWQADNVRITNDPFSPPELELRAETVTLTRETPLRTRIKTTRQRLVFDQGFSLPIPRDETVIDRNERNVTPGLAQIGYDGEDRGGLFVERSFTPINTEQLRVRLTPQFFAQQAVTESGGNVFDPALYGLKGRLEATLGPRTSVYGSTVLNSLELSEIEDNIRGTLRLRQRIGNSLPHLLTLEYSYRDRIYNGSLGYRTVQSSVGGVLTSPVIPLGKTGFNLSYQGSAQRINANTNRLDLLEPIRENNRISLNRLQGSAALSRGFLLWQGKPLPPTATEGLRYTPTPAVPYLQAFVGVNGTSSFYSSGDNQTSLTGTIGLQGQLGHFSRPFLDYTAFNVSYSQSLVSGVSPFIFDRIPDRRILSAGLTQQIYGPLRLGFQTSFNLDTSEQISTDYILEYSRRTYGIVLRYNPQLELGSLSLRISDFNWIGGTDPFSDSEVQPVVGGVRRRVNE